MSTKIMMRRVALVGVVLSLVNCCTADEQPAYRSHPPLRELPAPSERPMTGGAARYVDAGRGDDGHGGTADRPWYSINHALTQLAPGDTLYLRGGVYYEHVYAAVAGTAKAPITLRGYPGELAVIDGARREFCETPSTAWEPVSGGAEGEFRSARLYRNLRNVHGRFEDSMVGLQVYYHHEDLAGERYVGPGLWYDAATGHIHVRLQHYDPSQDATRAGVPMPSYAGETDPRRLPLIVAPFRSVPLTIDRAKHLVLQDLVIRGGGYDAVDIQHGENVIFDNVTVYAGTYGMRIRNTGPFRMVDCGVYGSVPPWSTRGETSLRERPWESKGRNLTRLNTHALLIPASGDEYSVYYFPYNHEWEISHCEFADAHDGVYLGDIDGLQFHHNLVESFQDDGIYLSNFRKVYYPQYPPRQIYCNVIRSCLMALAFGGDARVGNGVHVFRNIIDGNTIVADHGSPPWEPMRWYHNTFLTNTRSVFDLRHTQPGHEWQVFNNLASSGRSDFSKEQEGAACGGNVVSADVMMLPQPHCELSGTTAGIDAGVPIPADWPDPLRESDSGKPDAGALPAGAAPLKVGRFGRHAF